MKLAIAISTALLAIAPAIGFAQDASTTGRAAGSTATGPASENNEISGRGTKAPEAMTGRSSNMGQGYFDMYPPASNPNAPIAPDAPRRMGK